MFICIEGNIGVGKSTLATELAKKLDAIYLPEQFEENVLLPLFYEKPKTYAFPTEYSFLIDRHKQLLNHFKKDNKNKITVSDFDFDKCICFAKVNLTKKDYEFYKKHFISIQKTLPVPDLIVYLNTKLEHLENNIKKRGRKMEQEIPSKYLISLNKVFNKYYIRKKETQAKVLSLTIEEYNQASLRKCCNEIEKVIQKLKK